MLTVFFGVLGILTFSSALWGTVRHEPRRLSIVINWLLVLGVCAYATVLWGGQMLGLLKITPELGRPAIALALAAIAWLGILLIPRR